MNNNLTQEHLKSILKYNPILGLWTWKKSYHNKNIGKIAGYVSKDKGYRRIKICGKLYFSSRLAFLYMDGYIPEYHVDHMNRIRNDDRWENLRHISPQCNIRNCGLLSTNRTGIKGVYWNKKECKWKVFIYISGKYKHLGYFKEDEFEEAVLTRLAAEQCLGWSACDTSSTSYSYAITHNLIKEKR